MNMINKNERIDLCFNNCNSETNGELNLFKNLLPNKTILDVGCRYDSEFLKYDGEVHYFEPVFEFFEKIKAIKDNVNAKSVFNNFGLSSLECELEYYPAHQSFHNRIISCRIDDTENKYFLKVKKGKDYILENDIEKIHLLKIDVEGHEPNVIFGFEDEISKIDIIQFEYGGTYMDSNQKLENIVKYLKVNGFNNIGYLNNEGYVEISDTRDHYQYCNIVCFNDSFFEEL